MDGTALLVDAFDRIRGDVQSAVDGLGPAALAWRVDPEANSIAWLVWHLTRVQDDHVCDLAGLEQAWTAQGWDNRFDLPFAPGSTGFGHRSSDVAAVRVGSGQLLIDYHDAVHTRTAEYLRALDEDDLDRVIDETRDPPVTVGVRLVSVVNDGTQHAGQAAFVAGVTRRTGRGGS